ncbi:heme exporter protein CcmD [Sphingomonas baiyangensis]|uniref:Heme exporter protein CcmD n=1 Tax=Sphingomonas baiyangensis TaxID=2572576 RepID=A0A4U1L487_9SPHN|nr:heme exporter protein CcmD [Sphingomonas baiyangensis]TKD50966.1 heme exporter protein CcmD [Sphingomonas baiyangensis]
MNHWAFVTAAYVVGLGGTGAIVLQSWLAMRRAERAADELRRR